MALVLAGLHLSPHRLFTRRFYLFFFFLSLKKTPRKMILRLSYLPNFLLSKSVSLISSAVPLISRPLIVLPSLFALVSRILFFFNYFLVMSFISLLESRILKLLEKKNCKKISWNHSLCFGCDGSELLRHRTSFCQKTCVRARD